MKAHPINLGITADSGGHLVYVMDAALAQAIHPKIERVTIVTRRFREAGLPGEHDLAFERVNAQLSIARVSTNNPRYCEKEALAAELPSFIDGFCQYLASLPAQPDVIHAHFADAATVAEEARQRFGIPFVYTPHSLAIDKRQQGLGDATLDARVETERRSIMVADGLIISSRDEAERQIPAYDVSVNGRIYYIPPGVPQRTAEPNTGTIVDWLDKTFDEPSKPIILAIARPVLKKNLSALVRAYSGDPALQAQANLVILAGQDNGRSSREEREVRAELRRLSDTPTLRRRVALPPRHDAADVTALYLRAARGGVFVNPALHEPFGLTLIEAAEAGVPVVATQYGGPREIVSSIGHGLLVEPRDTAAIAAACRAVIGDVTAHCRFRVAALANHGRYNWVHYAEKSTSVYRHLQPKLMLLACDIDHTLTGCRAAAHAFSRWQRDCAMPFIVATGRSFLEAQRVMAQWHLPEPHAYITDVGTRIMLPDAAGGWLPWRTYAALLDADWDRDAVQAALIQLGILPQAETTAGPHKLSYFGGVEDAAAIRATLSDAGLSARVVFSHGKLIDVLASRAGKASAIAAFAGRLGLTLANCVAAGDSGNDRDMLERCRAAIVVGNADEELATLAPRAGLYRAKRHHAAGVLEGLKRLGLASNSSAIAA